MLQKHILHTVYVFRQVNSGNLQRRVTEIDREIQSCEMEQKIASFHLEHYNFSYIARVSETLCVRIMR